MDLFNNLYNTEHNLLPYDGIVNYYGQIYDEFESKMWFDYLYNQIFWKNDQVIVFGKLFETKRKVAWYGDNHFEYHYSHMSKIALKWTKELLEIKSIVEELTNETYNSCLLNLYEDGSEAMGWHSDAEKELKENGAIASVSFGAERKFSFKHKTSKETVSLILKNASLLLMKGETQKHWLHRLPPSKRILSPRINLTFRTIVR